jgi:L-threonylcarbamoyladenylate synthase
MINSNVKTAVQLLKEGKLIAIPTETVYGLAANAFDPIAVAKIFEVKNRPKFDPLIVHSSSIERINEFVTSFSDKSMLLAETFWPGPLTLILKKKNIIPDIVTSGLDNVAVRIPKHRLTLDLLSLLEFPLAAPSANPYGYVSPTEPIHVQRQLGEKIQFILDGGPCKVGIESTIVGFENDKTIIYRLGGLSVEEIEEVIGRVEIKLHSSSNPIAPGQLEKHYAPNKVIILDFEETKKYEPSEIGAIVFSETIENIPEENQLILSKNKDYSEAARNLFSVLRQTENLPVKIVYAELLPEKGLGRPINDRLRRASARTKP